MRLTGHAAVLLLAAELAGDLGLPVPDVVEVETLLRRVAERGAVESDWPRVALASLLSWVGSNPGRIFTAEDRQDEQPIGGWLARRLESGELAIVGEHARRYVTDNGHDWAGAVRSWEHRGWLARGAGLTRSVRFGLGRARCYVLTQGAEEQVIGDAGGDL